MTQGAITNFARRAFRWALAHPTAVCALIVAALTLPSLGAKDVWFPDEVRHAAALRGLMEDGHWLVLHLGDAVYADKPPLYFWALAGLARAAGSTAPWVFMAAAALSGAGFLAALVAFGRTLGLSRQAILLAPLLLLSTWFFIERLHQPRMDLLFAGFILLSNAGFFAAAQGRKGGVFGFAMAALAVLTKGPLGVLLPILGLTAFLLRTRRLPQGFARQMAGGLALFTAIVGAYLGGAVWAEGPGILRLLILDQSVARALDAPQLSEPFYWYLPQGFLAFLPWSLALPVLPFLRRHRPPSEGVTYLWCIALASLVALSVPDYKTTHFVLLLLGPLALLSAHYMAPLRKFRGLTLSIAGLLALAALVAPFAVRWTMWPDHVQGAMLVATALGLAAMLALWARNARPLPFAAILTLGMVIAALPFYLVTIAGLNPIMAPRSAGEILAAQAARGHAIAQMHPDYFGIFDYHTGRPVTQIANLEALDRLVESAPCGVVAIRPQDLRNWTSAPDNQRDLGTQRLDYTSYQLVGWGGAECE